MSALATSDARTAGAAPFGWLTSSRLRLLTLALLLLAWEALPRLELVPPVILAPLSATLRVGYEEFGIFAAALVVTVGEILGGLVIAWVGGGLVGLVVGGTKPLRRVLLPLLSSVFAIPSS